MALERLVFSQILGNFLLIQLVLPGGTIVSSRCFSLADGHHSLKSTNSFIDQNRHCIFLS